MASDFVPDAAFLALTNFFSDIELIFSILFLSKKISPLLDPVTNLLISSVFLSKIVVLIPGILHYLEFSELNKVILA